MTAQEILRIVAFLERIKRPFEDRIAFAKSDAAWNMTLHLMACHLRGEPVTTSNLADAAQVPYATAVRKIHALIAEGQIEKTALGDRGKSFRLAPSADLLAAFVGYAKQVKAVLAETVGSRIDGEADEDYYFGAPDFVGELPPPPSLVGLRQGEGPELRFLLHDDNYFVSMRNMWSDLRNNLASRRSFELASLQGLHQGLAANARLADSRYDIVALNMPWLGEFVEQGALRPLDDRITTETLNPFDFHPAVWSTGQWGERHYAIPIYCTVEIMAARRDWFEAAGLASPRTFDQVVAAAGALHRPAQGRYGIGWNAAPGMPIATSFMVMMGCAGAPILDLPRPRRDYPWATTPGESLRPRILSPEGLEVLDFMHRLAAFSPPDILQMDWNRRIAAFLSGETAMTYAWSVRAARFEYDVASQVKRRVTYLPQPKGRHGSSANPIGGFLLAIPSNLPEARARLAYEAIAWMASPSAMKRHVTNGLPVAPRFSVAADPEAQASSPIVRFIDKIAQRGLLCSWQRPPIPEYPAIEEALGTFIHQALTGELDDRKALACAQDAIDAALRARGRY
ncbi:MAG: hypothetical protein Kilf2KO_05450 [Rhodospirillales bacterium]